jgi:hypothetical protein
MMKRPRDSEGGPRLNLTHICKRRPSCFPYLTGPGRNAFTIVMVVCTAV